MRLYKAISISLSLCLVLVVLSSCDLLEGIRTNKGTGTPAVIQTPVSVVPDSDRGNTYAYIASNQLWMVKKGAKASQVTHFDNKATPNVYWHVPLWSPTQQYLAAIVSAQPASHQRVLAMGHSPPRLCSLRSQYR